MRGRARSVHALPPARHLSERAGPCEACGDQPAIDAQRLARGGHGLVLALRVAAARPSPHDRRHESGPCRTDAVATTIATTSSRSRRSLISEITADHPAVARLPASGEHRRAHWVGAVRLCASRRAGRSGFAVAPPRSWSRSPSRVGETWSESTIALAPSRPHACHLAEMRLHTAESNQRGRAFSPPPVIAFRIESVFHPRGQPALQLVRALT